MIKYDIGFGKTSITVGIAKVEQGTVPDRRIKYDFVPMIAFERLLNAQEIGSPVTEDTQTLDGVGILIHNREGLDHLEKMIGLLREAFEKKEADERRIDDLIEGYNQRYKEKCKNRCPYTDKYCKEWKCGDCEVEASERKWMEAENETSN